MIMHKELANAKIFKFQWRYDCCYGHYNLSNLQINSPKFWDFNGISTHGLCIIPAVLYQLSYEYPYIVSTWSKIQ